jgi:hypothetical protein
MKVACAELSPFCTTIASAAAISACGLAPSNRRPGTGVNGTAICNFG